jgi:dynein heavy chain
MVVDWSHQVQGVLKKSSAQPLLQGKNPGPLVEIEFWVARRDDLESVVEQLCSDKVLKMSHLLEKTMSSYYPSYCSMLQTIDQALDEARDIRSA